jgi:hypothetical protein
MISSEIFGSATGVTRIPTEEMARAVGRLFEILPPFF